MADCPYPSSPSPLNTSDHSLPGRLENEMIAIETKFHGPTNTKGSRTSATCCNCLKRTYVSYDHALDGQPNHRAAAEAHLQKHHRWFNDELRVRVDEGHETREGYVFPMISCDPR